MPAAATGMMARAARHYAAGRSTEARRCCEAVLRADPGHGDAQHLLGVLLLDQGDANAAITALERATAFLPGQAQVRYHLGNALLASHRAAEAEAAFLAAIDLDPGHIDARNNLGNACLVQQRYQEAAAYYTAVLVARPGFPPALYNLGNALFAQGLPQEAETRYRAALVAESAGPDPERFAQVWCHLGVALMAQVRHEEAIACFDEALRRMPGDVLAESNRGMALLSLGRLPEGWVGYERRWDMPGFEPPEPEYAPTALRNPDAMSGHSVLLRYEQGAGDTLQFVRYAPLLAARGAQVHLFVQAGLGALLASIEGVTSVQEAGQRPPRCDAIWPMASLPRAFHTDLVTIPADIPYLSVPPDRAVAWRERLGPLAKRRIGLAWSGAAGHAHDRLRSIPARHFAQLLRVPDCEYHLLQTEVRRFDDEWLKGEPSIVDHRRALADFAETAAAVSVMDLVITVDTSLAHVAAALGKPTWILLAYSAEWRWMTNRIDSPWHPTARLFRQPRPGDWEAVLNAVEAALRDEAQRPTA